MCEIGVGDNERGNRYAGESLLTRSDFRDYTSKLYQVISSPQRLKGWESIRSLYHPDARLVRTGLNADGIAFAKAMSLDAYIDNVETVLAGVEFSEIEIKHEARIFGNVAQVTSIYESVYRTQSDEVRRRGVNFINLVHGSTSWLIMSIVWDNERDGLSVD